MSTALISVPSPRLRDRILAHPLTRAVLALLCVLVPMAVVLGLSELVPKPLRTGWQLPLAACAIVAGYSLYVRKVERRPVAELALQGAWRELGSGFGIGALLVVLCTVIMFASGVYAYTGMAQPGVLLKPLPEQVMVAFFEEILFRAIVFRLLEKSWGTSIAMVVSTLLFILAHLPNEGFSVLSAVITGVASAALAGAWLVTRRLWLPIGMHFAWNYLFDAFLSVPVSGHPARGWVQIQASGPEWLSGGAYGIEGSVVTLLAWGAATIVLLTVARRRGHWLSKP
jgi:membrane protease YdiL (CAAX protease family)